MPKIFIDAGHGGKDTGANNGNLNEKDIALQLVLKLNDILQRSGFDTALSRSTDVFVPLLERARKANGFNADIFVSIHLNAAADKIANGIETLVYQNKDANNRLATNIQIELISMTCAKNRGIKERPDLVVLNSTKMPAVLIETGFISNDKEKNLLSMDVYQNKIAQAIANGIFKYFGLVVKDMVEVKDIDTALKVLQSKGIINSPEYWIKASCVVKYLDTLIINMAKKLC